MKLLNFATNDHSHQTRGWLVNTYLYYNHQLDGSAERIPNFLAYHCNNPTPKGLLANAITNYTETIDSILNVPYYHHIH